MCQMLFSLTVFNMQNMLILQIMNNQSRYVFEISKVLLAYVLMKQYNLMRK